MEQQTPEELGRILVEAAETKRPIEERHRDEAWKPMPLCDRMFDLHECTYRVQPEPRKPRECWRIEYPATPSSYLSEKVYDYVSNATEDALPSHLGIVHFREVLPDES